ncbi:hypothetical protein IAR55_002934 [Kwoniella newhampshirensis]|uniref:Uncharacterized protein n=1 Tax=Kwoniella newhampshirensis TaxID=1651941 RepID=A0AAW0Z022_9TREE
MDYLTILATRALILFPPTWTSHESLITTSRLASSPTTTPPTSHLLLSPTPISIPISSILNADTDCAYFLIHHILSTTPQGGLRTTDKEVLREAEVVVWREIDRAKLFTRALGAWFANAHKSGVGKLGERELGELAEKYGLGLQNESSEVGQEGHTNEDREVERMGEQVEKIVFSDEADKGEVVI